MSELSVSPHFPTVSTWASAFSPLQLKIYTGSLQVDPRKEGKSVPSTFPSGMFTQILAAICQHTQLLLNALQHVRLSRG